MPSVAAMLRRMQEQGLVDVGGDQRIRLTQRGIAEGGNIAQRHRLAEWMVETEVDRVSIGYDFARQIVVRPHEPES